MKKRKIVSQHVVKHGRGWALKRAGSTRATKVFTTQKDAFTFGRTVSINQRTELFVHGRNGRIRMRNSYGRDSFPPRG